MAYTFIPKEKHAKAYGNNMRISYKKASFLCKVIKKKPLTRAKRLLQDMIAQTRSLDGKYYTKTAKEMLMLLNSCEKNAEAQGLDTDYLMVHASAHKGTHFRRRRRKQNFGPSMKTANVEVVLIERVPHDVVHKRELKHKEEHKKHDTKELKERTESLREKSEDLEKKVESHIGKDIPTHADKRKKKSE